jgi:hypothetical protein
VRWVKFLNSKTIPSVVSRVLNVRSGTLRRATARLVDARGKTEGAGVYDFSIDVSLPGRSRSYGGVQEYGRAEGGGTTKAKYYMVPLSRQWGRSSAWTRARLNRELSKPGIFWMPRGEGNYMEDRAGRDVKFVFQMNPNLAAKYKKGKFERALIKSRQRIIAKASREKKKKIGKELTRGESLKSWAKLLFLAYPDTVTSIPGTSAYARSQGSRVSNYRAGILPAGIGGGQIRGRGPGEASRWWSRSLVEAAPELQKYMKDPAMRRAIRGALQQSLAAASRGRMVPRMQGQD